MHQLINNGISPNGIVLSPDEKSLYVAMYVLLCDAARQTFLLTLLQYRTRDNSVWRMPILPDGTTTKANRFCEWCRSHERLLNLWLTLYREVMSFGNSGPDGLTIDEEGVRL